MLFRAGENVTTNHDLVRPEKFARQDVPITLVSVDLSKSINFNAVEPDL